MFNLFLVRLWNYAAVVEWVFDQIVREEHWFEVRVHILTRDFDEVAVSSLDCACFCWFRRIHDTSDIWKRNRIASCIGKLQVGVSSHLELDRFLPKVCVDNLKLRFELLLLELQRWCEWFNFAVVWAIWRCHGRFQAYFWRCFALIVFNFLGLVIMLILLITPLSCIDLQILYLLII